MPTFLFNYFGQLFVDEVAIFLILINVCINTKVFQYNRISLSLYNSPWYVGSTQFQKAVLFVHMAASREITLTAGKIMDMNMDTFKGVRKFIRPLLLF